MGVAPTVPWGRWPMAPSLILLVTYQTISVPILVLSSKSAQFVQKWQLIHSTTVVSHIYTYDRAKTLSFISLIRRKNTEFENESNV